MLDVVFVAVVVGFFALCVQFVKACDLLTGGGSPDPLAATPEETAVEAAEEVVS